jgi:putative ABC transport system permease protein
MPGADVGFLGLAASLALVGVAVALSAWQRLGLEGRLVWAAARALGQLLLVGLALGLVIDPQAPLALSFLWVAGMVVFAADTARRRAPEVPRLQALALAAFAATSIVSLVLLFGLGVFPLEPRTLVPLAGLTIGNSMTATVLAARRIVEELRDKRAEVEARLALGQPASVAARPYVRRALRTALVPQIETTKAVGIVFLPGAMTGLILAGVKPIDAVLVQAVVMYLVLAATAVAAAVVALGLVRQLFTPDHRLRRLPRPADT